MKKLSLTCAALLSLLTFAPSAQADVDFIAGVGGGVAFGYGDLGGNGPLVDGEFGCRFNNEGNVATTLAIGLTYTELDYNFSTSSSIYSGKEDVLTLAPRVRFEFPIDEVISFYAQAQVGVNFSDVMADFGLGGGAGLDFRFSELVQARVGYQITTDVDGTGYHGVLAGIRFTF
jgi:opacity protein-like surface antigen